MVHDLHLLPAIHTKDQYAGLGKEKMEPLTGLTFCALWKGTPTDSFKLGLTDKEIEDRVTGLVKTEI